jgi:ribokinase
VVTVCVVGGLNMDLVVKSPRLPSEGETLTGGVFSTFPGGKGANQAVAAARLGAAVAMVGRVGTDAFGQRLVQSLETEGVNTRCVRLDAGSATGVACVTVDADGRNTIVVAPGANGNVSDEDIYSAGAVVAGAQVVLLQLEIPLAAVLQTSRIAHARGAVVVLDPAPAAPLPDELYSLVDVLNPNQSEAAALTGMSVRSPADAERAARALFARGPRTIVIKLGGQGAWYLSAERQGTSRRRL